MLAFVFLFLLSHPNATCEGLAELGQQFCFIPANNEITLTVKDSIFQDIHNTYQPPENATQKDMACCFIINKNKDTQFLNSVFINCSSKFAHMLIISSISNNSTATFSDCYFRGNSGYGVGGLIAFYNKVITVTKCEFSGSQISFNQEKPASLFLIQNSTTTFSFCLFFDNNFTKDGNDPFTENLSLIFVSFNTSLTLKDNRIIKPSTDAGSSSNYYFLFNYDGQNGINITGGLFCSLDSSTMYGFNSANNAPLPQSFTSIFYVYNIASNANLSACKIFDTETPPPTPSPTNTFSRSSTLTASNPFSLSSVFSYSNPTTPPIVVNESQSGFYTYWVWVLIALAIIVFVALGSYLAVYLSGEGSELSFQDEYDCFVDGYDPRKTTK